MTMMRMEQTCALQKEMSCDKLEKVVAEWRMWMETKEAFITRAQMFIARSFET